MITLGWRVVALVDLLDKTGYNEYVLLGLTSHVVRCKRIKDGIKGKSKGF